MNLKAIADKTIVARTGEIKHYERGKTQDIVETILEWDKLYWSDTERFAPYLKGQNLEKTAENIHSFIRDHFRYLEDKDGQYVKAPGQMWVDKVGDCKSFSLFAGSILHSLGIPYAYRFTTYPHSDGRIVHVYVIVNDQGRTIVLDSTLKEFDYEVPFVKAFDYEQYPDPALAKIAGIRSIAKKAVPWATLFLVITASLLVANCNRG